MKLIFKRLDDRGLTLVELMVAVVILGIIVTPLLHSFVTSARLAARSRQYGDATTAAQNIIETVEATDSDALLQDASLLGAGARYMTRTVSGGVPSYTDAAAIEPDAAGKYYIGMPVVSGGTSFDALVTLDASSPINNARVTEYTKLVATSQATGANDPDLLAQTNFIEAVGEGTPDSLTRTIVITVGEKTPEGGGAAIRYPISISYDYSGLYTLGTGSEARTYHFAYSQSSETYYSVATSDIVPGEPEFSMYFFFNTFYGLGVSFADEIKVYNDNNNAGPGSHDLQFNLFLVRQKLGDNNPLETTYSARIYQYEPYGLGVEDGTYLNSCKIYTNMSTNLNTGGDISAFDYRVYRNAISYSPGTEEPRLVVSNATDRYYLVDVQLFPRDSGYAGAALAEMKTSKLD